MSLTSRSGVILSLLYSVSLTLLLTILPLSLFPEYSTHRYDYLSPIVMETFPLRLKASSWFHYNTTINLTRVLMVLRRCRNHLGKLTDTRTLYHLWQPINARLTL